MWWILLGLLGMIVVSVLPFLGIILRIYREGGEWRKNLVVLVKDLVIILILLTATWAGFAYIYGAWVSYPDLLRTIISTSFWGMFFIIIFMPIHNGYIKNASTSNSLNKYKNGALAIIVTVVMIGLFILLPVSFVVFESNSGVDWFLMIFYLTYLSVALPFISYFIFKRFPTRWANSPPYDFPEERKKLIFDKKDYSIAAVLIVLSLSFMLVVNITPALHPEVYHNDIEDRVTSTMDFPDSVSPDEVRLVPWSVAQAYLERVYGDSAAYLDTSASTMRENTHPTVVNGNFVWLNVPQFESWKWFGGRKLPFYVMVNATGREIHTQRVDVEMEVSESHIEWSWRINRIVRKVAGENYNVAQVRFDLDDNYHPYYIVYLSYHHIPYYYETIEKLVIIDAVDGSAKVVDPKDAPSWLEVVYPDEYVYKWVSWWAINRNGWYYKKFVKTNLFTPDLPDAKFLLINGTSYWYIPLKQLQSHVLGGYMLVNTRTGESKFYNRASYNYVDYSTAWVQLHTYLSSGEMGYMQLSIREGYLYTVDLGNGTKKEVYILPLYAGLSLQKIAIIDPVNYQSKPTIAEDVESAIEMLKRGESGGNEESHRVILVDGMYISSTMAYIYTNSSIITIDKESLKLGENSADEDWVTLEIAYSKYLHGDSVYLNLTYMGDLVIDVNLNS